MAVRARFANHVAAQAPPDHTVLWRYFNLPKLLGLFLTKGLFFARSDKLGDPFEGTFPINNLNPTYHAVAQALGPHIAHAAGEKERLTQAFLQGVRDLRPKTLVTTAGTHRPSAVSPDGNRMAYVTADDEELGRRCDRRLWDSHWLLIHAQMSSCLSNFLQAGYQRRVQREEPDG